MKPDAPDAIRGEFKPIASRAPGVHVCERLPRIARVMDKVTLIRSLRHEMKNHNSAGYYSLTGYAPPTDDQRLRDSQDLFPAYGSVVDALAPARAGMPTFVSYPYVIADGSVTPGQTRQLPRQGPRPAVHRPGPQRARLPPARTEPARQPHARPPRRPPGDDAARR